MKKLTKNIKKRRLGRLIGYIDNIAQDIGSVDKIVQHKLQQHMFRSSPNLPKRVVDYETQMLDDSIAPHVRRLQGRYKPIKQRFSSVVKPLVGLSSAPLVYEQTKQSSVKKGLVNPTLHEIRSANQTPTRTAIKYAPSTYAQSIDGMTGTGYNRNSNKLRQLQEDATTLATGGRPNPEHNNKRFYGLFGITATNEPQKAMTMTQRAQRNINQSLRTGHSNRRMAKSAIQKGSYSNSFVSGSAVDPNLIVQPKKGRRFKGQTTGMTIVSKRAKTIRKESGTTSGNAFGFTDEQKQLGDSIAGGALGMSALALGVLARRKSQRAKAVARNMLRPSPIPSLRPQQARSRALNNQPIPRNVTPSRIRFQNQALMRNRLGLKPGETVPEKFKPQLRIQPSIKPANSGYSVPKNTMRFATPEMKRQALEFALKNKKKISLGGLAVGVSALGDMATLGGGIVGQAKGLFNTNTENKVNTSATPNENYKKPIAVHDERFDVRENKWKKVNEGKWQGEWEGGPINTDEALAIDFGDPSYLSSDSDAYKATAFEDLPTRLKNEYAMYGRPVETRIRQTSKAVADDNWRNTLLTLDPSVFSMVADTVLGNKLYSDYGEPFLGGRTPYRTSLANAVGNNPVSTITGYAMDSSRDGQKSLSAKGAIDVYKENFKNEINYTENEFYNLQNEYQLNPSLQNRKKLMQAERKAQQMVDAYKILDSIGGRVNSLSSLQKEIDKARATNNTAVLNLLTQPISFSYLDGEDVPALYDMAGYQSPLRQSTISRVGDKYGQNLMPYNLRSDTPQSVSYMPNSELNDEGGLSSVGNTMLDLGVGLTTGITPSGLGQVQNIDNDWMIGTALSRSPVNSQPIYVNSGTTQPFNPATQELVENRPWLSTFTERAKPYKDLVSSFFGFNKRQKTKSKSTTSRTMKKSSLTQSPLMPPMGSAKPIKILKPSVSQSNDMFVKSLNPNPKPIKSVHPKHENKYFK